MTTFTENDYFDKLPFLFMKWHRNNGFDYEPNTFMKNITYWGKNNNKDFEITQWDLESPTPTKENLLQYTQEDITNIQQEYNIILAIKKQTPIPIVNDLDTYNKYAQNGTMVMYQNKLYVYVEEQWLQST